MPEDEEGIQFNEAQGGGSHTGDHEHTREGEAQTGPQEVLNEMGRMEEPMLPPEEHAARAKRHGNGNGHGKTRKRTLAASVEAGSVTVRGLVAVARAEESATVTGASGVVVSGNDSKFTGGAGLVTGGDKMTMTGGAGMVVGRSEVDIDRGGAAMVAANKVTVKDHGYVGVALGKVKVKDGGRVIISVLPAMLIGATVGLAYVGFRLLTDRRLRRTFNREMRQVRKDAGRTYRMLGKGAAAWSDRLGTEARRLGRGAAAWSERAGEDAQRFGKGAAAWGERLSAMSADVAERLPEIEVSPRRRGLFR